MENVINIVNHLLPVVITAGVILLVIALRIGIPKLRFINLVAQSDTDQGTENLARYLAKQTGGRHINVDDTWRSFLPAASRLNQKRQEQYMHRIAMRR